METVNILSKFTHSQHTNFNKFTLTNHDAALIVIASQCVAKTKNVKAILRQWRNNNNTYEYLFNTSKYGGYGFVGKDINSIEEKIGSSWDYWKHITDWTDTIPYKTSMRKTYWFRIKPGYYAPTLLGWSRFTQILDFLNENP
jgi:hypothetical protein